MTRRLTPDEERAWRSMTSQAAGVDPGRVRRTTAEERRLWRDVTGVAPLVGTPTPAKFAVVVQAIVPKVSAPQPVSRPPATPGPAGQIEPNRHRRLVRERDPIEARIDLHGLDQDRAMAALERFITWSYTQNYRAVLVITGKGVLGDGVLRQRTPEWLAAPPLRDMIAGVARADRRHGGDGALYVALRRRR